MMTQSLPGLLNNSADYLETMDAKTGGISHGLRTLLVNLRELRERKTEGEKVLNEFFAIYTGWGD